MAEPEALERLRAAIAESVRLHRKVSRRDAWSRAIEMLDLVGIPDSHRRVRVEFR